jgi:hypothetical protein
MTGSGRKTVGKEEVMENQYRNRMAGISNIGQ